MTRTAIAGRVISEVAAKQFASSSLSRSVVLLRLRRTRLAIVVDGHIPRRAPFDAGPLEAHQGQPALHVRQVGGAVEDADVLLARADLVLQDAERLLVSLGEQHGPLHAGHLVFEVAHALSE